MTMRDNHKHQEALRAEASVSATGNGHQVEMEGGFFEDLARDCERFWQEPSVGNLWRGSALMALALHGLVLLFFVIGMKQGRAENAASFWSLLTPGQTLPPWYFRLVDFGTVTFFVLLFDLVHLAARRPRQARALWHCFQTPKMASRIKPTRQQRFVKSQGDYERDVRELENLNLDSEMKERLIGQRKAQFEEEVNNVYAL